MWGVYLEPVEHFDPNLMEIEFISISNAMLESIKFNRITTGITTGAWHSFQ